MLFIHPIFYPGDSLVSDLLDLFVYLLKFGTFDDFFVQIERHRPIVFNNFQFFQIWLIVLWRNSFVESL